MRRSTNSSGTTLTVYAFGLEDHVYNGSGANQGNTYYYSLAGRLLGAMDSNGTVFYLTDALGSVLGSFSNVANGAAVKGNQVFGPYGKARYTKGTINTAKGFTGQYNDSLTGLDYYNSRYYDPVAGVFLSADTAQGNLQGMNPYAYVGGNPETMSDPTGRYVVGLGGERYYPGVPNNSGSTSGKKNQAAGSSSPCLHYCEVTDVFGNPLTNSGISYLRSSGISDSDMVVGVGRDGLTSIITDLQAALLKMIASPLAASLNPNRAGQMTGILAIIAALGGLVATLASGGTMAGTLISATFGTASAVEQIDSSSPNGPGSAQIDALINYVNHNVIRPLLQLAGRLPDKVLDKMVFSMVEVDTYAQKPVYSWVQGSRAQGRYISGYQTDYSTIASAQFEVDFYTS